MSRKPKSATPGEDFPGRLRQARQARELTQEQLGERAAVTKVSVSLYESGRRSPDLGTLQLLADALDVSVDYLMGRQPAAATDLDAGLVKVDDPAICKWFDELMRAPQEYREELHKIWGIIKKRGLNRR